MTQKKSGRTPVESPEESRAEVDLASSGIEELQLALQQKDDQLLRVLADFDNYRKRTAKETQDICKTETRELLLGILEVLDSFERALKLDALKADTPVSAGFRSIYKQLQQLLEQFQVVGFDSKGQHFDPSLHEAIHTIENRRHSNGIIVEECRKGYVWHWRVLRPAQVIVVKNSED